MENSKLIDQYKLKGSKIAITWLCEQFPDSNRRQVERKAGKIINQYKTLLKRNSEEKLLIFLLEIIFAPVPIENPRSTSINTQESIINTAVTSDLVCELNVSLSKEIEMHTNISKLTNFNKSLKIQNHHLRTFKIKCTQLKQANNALKISNYQLNKQVSRKRNF